MRLFSYILVIYYVVGEGFNRAEGYEVPSDLCQFNNQDISVATNRKSMKSSSYTPKWENPIRSKEVQKNKNQLKSMQIGQFKADNKLVNTADRKCGVPDNDALSSKKQMLSEFISRNKWHKKKLTWSLRKPNPNIPLIIQRNIIKAAFKHWTDVTNLQIDEISSPKADIIMSFESLNHLDGHNFDGRGGVLAHAFYPADGRIHFDEDEAWMKRGPSGANLEMAATHEIGHALGLRHSAAPDAVMAASYPGLTDSIQLHSDDIKAIQKLYGHKKEKSEEIVINVRVKSRQLRHVQLRMSNICNMKFDDIVKLADNKIYIFRQGLIFKLDEDDGGVEVGWPKPVYYMFNKFPKSCDAATYSSRSNRFYAFKGRLVWRYYNNRLESGFPAYLTGDVPTIVSAFTWNNGYIYVLSEKDVYIFGEVSLQLFYRGRLKDIFIGAPYSPEAALWLNSTVNGGGIYLFRGKWYYRVNDKTRRVERGYPHFKNKQWLNCPPSTRAT